MVWKVSAASKRAWLALMFVLAGGVASRPHGQSAASAIEAVTVTPPGVPAGGQTYVDSWIYDRSGPSHISADNRYVVFASASEQLVPGDSNGYQDVFLRDR